MWIFLLILKWIFIILGILLGLVLLFMALVLCVPVRYRAAGDNHEKIQYSFKVSWLLSIIAVKKKKDSEQIVFSVFGIPIKRMGNEKPVKKTVVKSEKEKEPEPLQDNKEETGEPVLAAQEEKKKQRKDKKKRTFSRTKKAKKKKSKKSAVIGMIAGTLFMAFIGCFLNAFVLLPAYGKAFGMPVDALVAMGTAVNPAINSLLTFVVLAVAPFNILKGLIVGVITFLLYKHVSPILHGTQF